MIKLNERLWVSQEWLRKTCQIDNMVRHVKNGGMWTREALDEWAVKTSKMPRACPLVQITEFPDGNRMIQDGHHRTVSTIRGGRYFLTEKEYQIQYWSYAEYLEINLKNGWYTPYDPRTEVRIEDIGAYKEEVRRLLGKDVLSALTITKLPPVLIENIEPYKAEIHRLFDIDVSDALSYIRDNRVLYVVSRRIKTVLELAELIFPIKV